MVDQIKRSPQRFRHIANVPKYSRVNAVYASLHPAQGCNTSLRVCKENGRAEATTDNSQGGYGKLVNKYRVSIQRSRSEMRDLYNRKKRLNNCIGRINTDLDGTDKEDAKKLLEIMQEKDQSILNIIKCVGVILQIRRQLGKPSSQVTKEDIKSLFRWMDDKGYMMETHEKFRAVLKKFYKMVYGNNEYYPDCVKWFTVKVGKDKRNQERQLDMLLFTHFIF